jgi:hypothetical protein
MGNQIYLKIAGYVDLAVLIIFTPCQISDIINGFWVITPKPAILPYVLFLVTVAMLVGAQHHQTQFWN